MRDLGHDLNDFSGSPEDPQRKMFDIAHLLDAGRWADAHRMASSLVAEIPDHPEAWRLLGDAQMRLRNWVEAERCARRVVSLDPESFLGHFLLARSLWLQGARDEAESCARVATRLEPEDALGWALLAQIGSSRPHPPDEALHAARQAVRLAPDSAFTHVALGAVLAKRDPQAAREALEQALRIDPQSSDALTELAALPSDHPVQVINDLARAATPQDYDLTRAVIGAFVAQTLARQFLLAAVGYIMIPGLALHYLAPRWDARLAWIWTLVTVGVVTLLSVRVRALIPAGRRAILSLVRRDWPLRTFVALLAMAYLAPIPGLFVAGSQPRWTSAVLLVGGALTLAGCIVPMSAIHRFYLYPLTRQTSRSPTSEKPARA